MRLILIVCLVLAICHGAAFGQGTNQRPAGSTGKVKVPATTVDQRVEKFSKAVGGLSVKQKAKVKVAIERYFANLRVLAKNDKLTESQRITKQNEHEAKFNAEVRAMLTPEQKKKFDKMVADAKKRKQSGMRPQAKPVPKAGSKP